MARIVVLQFDDNEAADLFLKEHGGAMYYPVGSMGGVSNDAEPLYSGELVGLFAMPTQFCPQSGSGGCNKNKRVVGWQRGRKFGWWVCAICKKPSGFVPPDKPNEIWRRVVSQGVNLLREVTDQHIEKVDDEGWGVGGRG